LPVRRLRLPLRLERLRRLRRLRLRRLLLVDRTLPRLLEAGTFPLNQNDTGCQGRVALDPAGPVSFAIGLLIFDLIAADTRGCRDQLAL
jgi:hypothetical protein